MSVTAPPPSARPVERVRSTARSWRRRSKALIEEARRRARRRRRRYGAVVLLVALAAGGVLFGFGRGGGATGSQSAAGRVVGWRSVRGRGHGWRLGAFSWAIRRSRIRCRCGAERQEHRLRRHAQWRLCEQERRAQVAERRSRRPERRVGEERPIDHLACRRSASTRNGVCGSQLEAVQEHERRRELASSRDRGPAGLCQPWRSRDCLRDHRQPVGQTNRLFRSTNGGHSWQPADRGLASTYFSALAFDPTAP